MNSSVATTLLMALHCGEAQWRLSFADHLRTGVAARREQQPHARQVALLRCRMEWCAAIGTRKRCRCARTEQELHTALKTTLTCHEQGRGAGAIAVAVDTRASTSVEQHPHALSVAILTRFKKDSPDVRIGLDQKLQTFAMAFLGGNVE